MRVVPAVDPGERRALLGRRDAMRVQHVPRWIVERRRVLQGRSLERRHRSVRGAGVSAFRALHRQRMLWNHRKMPLFERLRRKRLPLLRWRALAVGGVRLPAASDVPDLRALDRIAVQRAVEVLVSEFVRWFRRGVLPGCWCAVVARRLDLHHTELSAFRAPRGLGVPFTRRGEMRIQERVRRQ